MSLPVSSAAIFPSCSPRVISNRSGVVQFSQSRIQSRFSVDFDLFSDSDRGILQHQQPVSFS